MARRFSSLVAGWLCAAALALATGPAGAQGAKPPTRPALEAAGLAGPLAEISRTGIVRIGYREASVPFSFLDRSGRPVGYSIDICNGIVEEIGRTLGREDLRVEYLKVTSETRLAAVADGSIHLECGSTTANLERAKLVSFSPLIFVAGTRVMVPKGTPWRNFRNLQGKRVVVTAGTTNAQALRKLDEKFKLGIEIVEAPDHEQSYQMLVDRKVDAFATDDVLLSGLIAQHHAQDRFAVVGELLSYDPYGIAYALNDKPMKEAIERAFQALVRGNEIDPIYNKWFNRPLPNGERLRIPMTPQLEEAFKAFDTDRTSDPAAETD